jgi:uncharacterized LabA/DUF88 family protein
VAINSQHPRPEMVDLSLDKSERERSKLLRELIDVSKPLERTMAFIDGGYLRRLCRDICPSERINFMKVFLKIREVFSVCLTNQFQLDLIRVYYYDAIPEGKHPEYDTYKAYFDEVKNTPLFKLRLGRLVDSQKEGLRQKGVDILMSTDVLTKAYRNQYDTGIFVIGDGDFIPLIEAVNDAGKKTICLYGPRNTSEDLVESFDMSMMLGESEIRDLMEK